MDWKEEYTVGVKEIDDQHKSLVDMITRLENCESAEKITEEMKVVIIEIVDYTKSHFKDEEEYMLKIKYPERGLHKIYHEDLIDKVIELLQNLKDGGEITREELLAFLIDWLKNHIIEEDLKIGIYFKEEILNKND